MPTLRVTLLQPNPKSGDFAGNLAAAASLAKHETDLVIAPIGTIEGGTGQAALQWPDLRAAYETVLASVPKAFGGRKVLLLSGTPEAPQWHLWEKGTVKSGGWPALLSVGGVTFGADDEADVRLDAADFSTAPSRRTAAPSEKLFLSAGIAGGQDQMIFAGDTGFSVDGESVRLPAWSAGAMTLLLEKGARKVSAALLETDSAAPVPLADDERYEALRAALRDYVAKSGVKGIVLGLSGGIDSALSATLAADAIGASRVRVVRLPSRFTSGLSNDAAQALAERQGLRLDTLPIESLFDEFNTVLAPVFKDCAWDITEENIQARVRGTLLMALANKYGLLLLCNGNKAEAAMGYGTLYGDLTGGFAPLADLWKDDVRALCRARNASAVSPDVIPEEIIEREPSAELREGQKDSDSLPPYALIERVVEHVAAGGAVADLADVDPAEARRIVKRLLGNAFKRAQGIPGPILTQTPLSLFSAWGINCRREF